MKISQAPLPAQVCAWFERNNAFPLLNDCIIIDFMSAYTEQHWPKVRCVDAVDSWFENNPFSSGLFRVHSHRVRLC
jgi:hypothetical protein